MKLCVVLDTNVIISAFLKENSVPYKVLQQALEENVKLLYSKEILSEYTEVLNRKKFPFEKKRIVKFLEDVKRVGKETEKADLSEINEEFPDLKDVVFYQVVMEGQKTEESYLVTGNIKHFPIKPFVVTPAQMLEIIQKSRN